MRHSASEKLEIIHIAEDSEVSVRQTLQELEIPRSTFYSWYRRYLENGPEGLSDKKPHAKRFWNKIPDEVKEQVVEKAKEETFISESSVYRILKTYDLIVSPAFILLSASDSFKNPTKRVNELWQTDFTYFKIIGWGWYYLLSVLDDYSRFIIAWKLCTTMAAQDVQTVLDDAIAKTGVDQVKLKHKPRLLSYNGPCFVAKPLQNYLE